MLRCPLSLILAIRCLSFFLRVNHSSFTNYRHDLSFCLSLDLSRTKIARCQGNTRQEGSDTWDGRKLLDSNGLPDKHAVYQVSCVHTSGAALEQTRRRAMSLIPSMPTLAQKRIRAELDAEVQLRSFFSEVTLRLGQREVECALVKSLHL